MYVTPTITLIGLIGGWIQLKNEINATIAYWQRPWDWVIIGTSIFLLCFLFLLLITLFVIIVRLLKKLTFYPGLFLSIRNFGKNVAWQANQSVSITKPKHQKIYKHNWEELAAASITGLSDKGILRQHAWHDQPILFCNFRGYANAVNNVLEEISYMLVAPV